MALEWLKTILGEAYNDDIDKKVSEEVGKNFVSRSDFNALNETKKTLDGQIKDRDKQLEDLKKVDAAGLQAEIAKLQSENTKTKADFEAQLKQIKLDTAIESKLRETKAVNAKAVRALLIFMAFFLFTSGRIITISTMFILPLPFHTANQ